MPGAEPAGARTILLDTPPAGRGGDLSLSLFGVPPLWGVGTSGQGEAGGLTCVGARDEPEAAILQRGIFQSNPHAQHPAQRLRIQEGGVLVRGDCSRPVWASGAWPHPTLASFLLTLWSSQGPPGPAFP